MHYLTTANSLWWHLLVGGVDPRPPVGDDEAEPHGRDVQDPLRDYETHREE